MCGCATTNPHVVIRQHLHLTIAQDEAQCNNEMSQLVEAVQASLPSTTDQPGFELVYITRFLSSLSSTQYHTCMVDVTTATAEFAVLQSDSTTVDIESHMEAQSP